MNRYYFSRLALFAVLAAVALAPGCGKKLPPMAHVSGKVTVNGQPLTGGQVSFIPDTPNPNDTGAKAVNVPETAGLVAGQIGSDGTYTIYHAGKEGAPLGKYKVTVSPSMIPVAGAKKGPPTGFHPKYGDVRNTPLRIDVVADAPPGKYDLKLTK